VFKVPSPYVQDDCFDELIEAGLDGDLNRSVGHKPWKGHCSIDDFLKLRRYMTLLMRVTQEKGEGDRKTYFPDNVYMLFRKIVRTLSKDAGAGLSDRKVIKLYRIIRTIAYLEDGGVVQPKHLRSLRYTANSAKDVQNVKDTVDNILRLES
jgi:MoxR-like ATPase